MRITSWIASPQLSLQANIASAISTIQANKGTEEGVAAAQGVRTRWNNPYIRESVVALRLRMILHDFALLPWLVFLKNGCTEENSTNLF